MVTSRTYEDVMKPNDKLKTKSRLGRPRTEKFKSEIQEYTMNYHSDINEILG